VSRSEIDRLRARLRSHPALADLAGLVRRRAEIHRYRAVQAAIDRLVATTGVQPTGISAEGHSLVGAPQADLCLPADMLDEVVRATRSTTPSGRKRTSSCECRRAIVGPSQTRRRAWPWRSTSTTSATLDHDAPPSTSTGGSNETRATTRERPSPTRPATRPDGTPQRGHAGAVCIDRQMVFLHGLANEKAPSRVTTDLDGRRLYDK